MASRYRT